MFEEAYIDTTGRFITNHLVVASLCTNLLNQGFDNQQISSRSGHQSKALWRYKLMAQSIEHKISNVLQPPKPKQAKPNQANSPNVTPLCKKVQSLSTIVRPDQESNVKNNSEQPPTFSGTPPTQINLASLFGSINKVGGEM